MTPSADVVIIGGGVIGLSAAEALARRGAAVTVLDAGHLGQASAAAAGMLAPLAESGAPGPFLDLALDSLRAWPVYAARLRDETGLDPELFGPGILRVARTPAEAQALCAALAWQRETGLPLDVLDGDSARRVEPALGPDVALAVRSPAERQVSPRRLLPALQTACARRGVILRHGTPALGLRCEGERVRTVATADGALACGALVVAGGAWSPATATWLGAALPVSPLRGQILSLGPCRPCPISHTIYTHSAYLVPRADGRIVVGATEEHVGFAPQTTAAGIASLLTAASGLAPSLADAPLDSTWVGLRPVSPDGLPLLGRLPGWGNVHVATGHGRNGILLTPVTGEIMAQCLLDGVSSPPAFDPARFPTEAL